MKFVWLHEFKPNTALNAVRLIWMIHFRAALFLIGLSETFK